MIFKEIFWCNILTFCLLIPNGIDTGKRQKKFSRIYGNHSMRTTKICLSFNQTARARHKSCLLRPDTGPCRADIIQWYYDVRQGKCFRFYWGGCQGNGNKFDKNEECMSYCALNLTNLPHIVPHFCSLLFDYGKCFGYFYRWAWDPLKAICRRHLYSGCGGNQNNFESYQECMKTCAYPDYEKANQILQKGTTCIPVEVPDFFEMSV